MSSRNSIRTAGMSESRRNEIEEMDQWELIELISEIRDIIWLGEDLSEVVKSIRELVGVHEDVEPEDDYFEPDDSDDIDEDEDEDKEPDPDMFRDDDDI